MENQTLNKMNSTHQKEIEFNENRIIEAMRNHDVKVLEELLHEDLLFVIPNGSLITKAIDIDNFKSGNVHIESISTNNQTIQLIDENAVVSVRIDLKGTFLNQPFQGTFRYLRVWKLIERKWKVIAGSGVQIS